MSTTWNLRNYLTRCSVAHNLKSIIFKKRFRMLNNLLKYSIHTDAALWKQNFSNNSWPCSIGWRTHHQRNILDLFLSSDLDRYLIIVNVKAITQFLVKLGILTIMLIVKTYLTFLGKRYVFHRRTLPALLKRTWNFTF